MRNSALWRRFTILISSILACSGFLIVSQTTLAGADTDTFTSTQIGSSGSTPDFSQSGQWLMDWSYNCSSYGSQGNFAVEVNQPAGSSIVDIGPNELGNSGSGVDYYYDTGQFNLSVDSECDWSITVEPTGPGSLEPPNANYSSTSTGDSGSTQRFLVSSAWTMSWTYDCTSYRSEGNFAER